MSIRDAKGTAASGGERVSDSASALLVRAGAVLSTSLDLRTTMSQVASLTVPTLADLCTIDLLDRDGRIREVAVAARDGKLAPKLEALRSKHPLDPAGEHPVARVTRTGEAELRASLDETLLRSYAEGEEHAAFMVEHDYRSAAIAPLLARGRTLGALSVLRLGDGEPYDEADLELVAELARRAALAIDNARLFSDLERIEQRLEAILLNIAEAVTLIDGDGQIVFANDAAAALLGASRPAELIDGERNGIERRISLFSEDGTALSRRSMPWRGRRSTRRRSANPLLLRAKIEATGEERWLLLRSSPLEDPETGRRRWSVNVFEDITELKRTQLAEAFLADASAALASSLDFRRTLELIAELPVPQLADSSIVRLLDPSGNLEEAAAGGNGADRSRAKAARAGASPAAASKETAAVAADFEAQATAPPGSEAQATVPPGSEAQATVPPGSEARATVPPGSEAQATVPLRSEVTATVPLRSAYRTLGELVLRRDLGREGFSPVDLRLAEELGRRAGNALEHSHLYTERTRIAHTLQQALLPEALPQVRGAAIEVLYSPAGELNEAGGDFYDVIERGEDSWLLVIGDVCGKGPRAAGVTALARHTLRASAIRGGGALEMLAVLHEALRRQPVGADLCTVCLVSVDRDASGASLQIALAGHPQPLLIDESGAARRVGEPGTLLGVIDPIRVSEQSARLRDGETLLLYTDGVAEAGAPSATLSEKGLIELCEAARGLSLAELLAMIELAALERSGGMRRDDIALLGLRLSNGGEAARGGGR
jgi:PAS domain S-box-containing protein